MIGDIILQRGVVHQEKRAALARDNVPVLISETTAVPHHQLMGWGEMEAPGEVQVAVSVHSALPEVFLAPAPSAEPSQFWLRCRSAMARLAFLSSPERSPEAEQPGAVKCIAFGAWHLSLYVFFFGASGSAPSAHADANTLHHKRR